ncbi:MAG: 4-(cytidine 5'-diphospho)-2-C-methyl-D-erythritol kinase [Bacillota bacterium]
MDTLELQSYAKVNLTLDVLEKRPEDGYHYVKTVMVPISLADRVVLKRAQTLSLHCSPPVPGAPEENLAYRAAELLRAATGYQGGAVIWLEKVIPVAGGLAGGSTNAAAVLVGLNQLWGTGLPAEQLIHLAIRLGSDIPFFIPSRPARVEGVGERLTPIAVAQPFWMVIATPDVAKSTGNVFRLFDELSEVRRPDTEAMEAALAAGDLKRMAASLGNVFEQVMLPRHPEIGRLKQVMLEAGALGALMSGAGPTVLGLVPDQATGQAVLAKVQPWARSAYLVQTRQ